MRKLTPKESLKSFFVSVMKIHIGNENQDCEMRDFILKQIQIEDIREQKRRAGRAAMLKSIMLESFETRLGEQQ